MVIPSFRRSPVQAALPPAHAFAPIVPVLVEAARARRIRRAVGITRNVSTLVTTVPFVPLPARVAAGAVTGVATAVDAVLRPAGERPATPSVPPPDDDAIVHDPALFAADAASAITAGAVAASQVLVSTARRPAVRRTVRILLVAGAVITVGVLGYRLVVAPAVERRRQRRREATALVVLPDVLEPAEAPATPAIVPGPATETATLGADGVQGPIEAAPVEVDPAPRRRVRRRPAAEAASGPAGPATTIPADDLPAPSRDAG